MPTHNKIEDMDQNQKINPKLVMKKHMPVIFLLFTWEVLRINYRTEEV